MRMSDWSSDVCSSDLVLSPRSVSVPAPFLTRLPLPLMTPEKLWRASVSVRVPPPERIRPSSSPEMDSMVRSLPSRSRVGGAPPPDRKGVVAGKSVSDRCNLGGGLFLTKQKLHD